MAEVAIYEVDLMYVTKMMALLKRAMATADKIEDGYVMTARVEVRSNNDYAIGEFVYEDEQWRFIPDSAMSA